METLTRISPPNGGHETWEAKNLASIPDLVEDLQSRDLPEEMSFSWWNSVYVFRTREERIQFTFGLQAAHGYLTMQERTWTLKVKKGVGSEKFSRMVTEAEGHTVLAALPPRRATDTSADVILYGPDGEVEDSVPIGDMEWRTVLTKALEVLG